MTSLVNPESPFGKETRRSNKKEVKITDLVIRELKQLLIICKGWKIRVCTHVSPQDRGKAQRRSFRRRATNIHTYCTLHMYICTYTVRMYCTYIRTYVLYIHTYIRTYVRTMKPLFVDTPKMQPPLLTGHHCSVPFEEPHIDMFTVQSDKIRTPP